MKKRSLSILTFCFILSSSPVALYASRTSSLKKLVTTMLWVTHIGWVASTTPTQAPSISPSFSPSANLVIE